MKIEVTKKDIATARRRIKAGYFVGENCPIALAVKRKLHKRVRVVWARIKLYRSNYTISHAGELPQAARSFLSSFDSDKPVKPFTFETTITKTTV